MISIIKKIGFVVAFVLVTLVLPCVVLLFFVDAAQNFAAYVITYGVIIFAILGYVIVSVRDMEKKLEETMEEIKMQNAAIAYKLTNAGGDTVAEQMVLKNPVSPLADANPVAESSTATATVPLNPAEPLVIPGAEASTATIPLNPADPLVMPGAKKESKAADDGFDDFK